MKVSRRTVDRGSGRQFSSDGPLDGRTEKTKQPAMHSSQNFIHIVKYVRAEVQKMMKGS
jgi:hypothetical protein